MTDVATAPAEPVTEAPVKVVKEPKQPIRCRCSEFLLADDKDVKEGDTAPLFDTECTQTTQRVFAQGHDARLVSFLVNGEVDGLTVLKIEGDKQVRYAGAAAAAAIISPALGAKAVAAVARLRTAQASKDERKAKQEAARKEKADAKAAKQAEAAKVKAERATKATPPRDVAVQVVEGSQTDDGPSLIKIKVGKGEYDGEISEVDGKEVVTYTNLRGEEETRDLDLVRVLTA